MVREEEEEKEEEEDRIVCVECWYYLRKLAYFN